MKSPAGKALILALALAVLTVGGWYGRKAYKAAFARMLVEDANGFLKKKDLPSASESLKRALRQDPMNLDATRILADLSEAAGSPAAVGWRIRAAQLKPNDPGYRLAWAKTALKMQDTRSAANALDGLDAGAKTTAEYHKLAGVLAWDLNLPAQAETHYAESLRLEPTNQSVMLNLTTIRLSSTNGEVARAARADMEKIARSGNAELNTPALYFLMKYAESHRHFDEAVDYSGQILRTPSAGFRDKLQHLTLLREAGSPRFAPWLASLQQQAGQSPDAAFLLGEWIAKSENPANALRWLQSLPLSIQTNQPGPLIITDCQIALKDWAGLLAFVSPQDWADLGYYNSALQALAQRSLGRDAEAAAAWRLAFRQGSRRLDSLARLARLTAAWRWTPENIEVLSKISTAFPSEKWAVDQLTDEFYAQGDTRAIEKLLLRIQALNPTDPRLKNNLAKVQLLLHTDTGKACRLAKEAYDTAPADPLLASTYAYSLLVQKKSEAAVKAFAQVKPEDLKIPVVAAYYGAVLAQSGNPALAKEPLNLAESAKLLPEELEMVRQAKAGL
jgi:Tfp pilus assembly protein PilF